MYVPQNFFDKFHAERLTMEGKRTIFTEYYERKKSMTMLKRFKESLASIWPPTHEEVEATVWYRLPSGVVGVKVISVSMPYRKWMAGNTLLDTLTEELDTQLKGMLLKGKPAYTFRNRPGISEVIMIGDPRTGKRYWNFFK